MGGISLSGLASGLDTNAMIEQLMQLERKPYENLQTKKSTLQERQSFVRSINTKLNTLRTAAADLMYTTSFNLTSSKVADSSVLTVQSTEFAKAGSYNVTVDQLAKQHVLGSLEFSEGGNALAALEGDTISISGKGNTTAETFTLTGATDDEILENLLDDINAKDLGIKASIIETSPGKQTLILTSDEMGTEASMAFGTNSDPNDRHTFINASADVLSGLGFTEKQPPMNAIATINGIQIEHTDNTLDGVVEGLTIELLKEGASSTVNVIKDANLVADKVQKFVDAYNDVISTLRSKTAKGALMQGDSTMRSLQDELSSILNASVDSNSQFKFLFSIGLEVDKGVTSGTDMTGKISFDRNKFKDAFNENPDEVYKLFAFDDTSESNKDGIGMLFNQDLLDWTMSQTGLLAYKISGYDSELEIINDQMETMELRLQNKEQQMLKQFAAMENALASLQNEQSWLSSQIASLGL